MPCDRQGKRAKRPGRREAVDSNCLRLVHLHSAHACHLQGQQRAYYVVICISQPSLSQIAYDESELSGWCWAANHTELCQCCVRYEEVVRSNQHLAMRNHRGTTQVNDDRFFEQALHEVNSQKVVPALWAKALADADGDRAKTVARYIKLRVQQLNLETPSDSAPASAQKIAPPNTGAIDDALEAPVQAKSWRRFVARLVDFMWEAPVVGATVGYLGSTDASVNSWLQETDAVVLGVLLTPLVLAFDAFVVAMFSNSPGKALLGLCVVDKSMRALPAIAYLARNMRLWVSGLALGLPALNLFAMAYQGDKVRKGGCATYDRASETQVVEKRVGLFRGLVASLLLVLLVSINAVLFQVDTGQSSALMARNDDWQLSVRALQGMVRNGTIDTVVGQHLERDQVSGGIWPSDDVLSIENGSTWWIEDGSFFIHIPNPSVYNIRTVRFHFEPRTCASSSSHETFHVQLGRPVAPGESVVATFSILPWQIIAEGNQNCLVIAGIWD